MLSTMQTLVSRVKARVHVGDYLEGAGPWVACRGAGRPGLLGAPREGPWPRAGGALLRERAAALGPTLRTLPQNMRPFNTHSQLHLFAEL